MSRPNADPSSPLTVKKSGSAYQPDPENDTEILSYVLARSLVRDLSLFRMLYPPSGTAFLVGSARV